MADRPDLENDRVQRYMDKLDQLDQRIDYIEEWTDSGELTEDVKLRFAVFKAFQEAAESITDICAMYLSDTGHGVGDDRENIAKAAGKLFDKDFEERLGEVNGLRNRVTHDYGDEFSSDLAVDSIMELVEIMEKFRGKVVEWIESR